MNKSISLMNLAVLLLTGAALAGCGGGGGNSNQAVTNSGRYVVNIKWPARGRLIPVASNSIKLVLNGKNGVIDTRVLARPASGDQTSTAFNNLGAGNVTLAASAFPTTDGTGVAQAAGSASGTVLNGKTSTITINMDSTIARLEVDPDDFFLAVGNTRVMTATAFDANNNVVLIDPTKITWSINSQIFFSITNSGVLKAITADSETTEEVTITATETESGKNIQGIATAFTNPPVNQENQ